MAFCRTVTELPPAGYDPAVSGCFLGDGAALPVYWSNLCVGYSLQEDASGQVSLADAKAVAAEAFAAWSAASCAGGGAPTITATEIEPPGDEGVACDEVQYNPYGPNQNVIVFRDQGWANEGDSVNTLGLTTITYDVQTGEIFDADMEINSHDFQLVPFPPAPAGAYDLLSVVTHEAGHFLGLAHSADPSAVMYAFYHPGSTTLQPDDVNGICSLDRPDGTRPTASGFVEAEACCPVPRHGLASACAAESPEGGVLPPAADAPEVAAVPACVAGEMDGGSASTTSSNGRGSGCAVASVTRGDAGVGERALMLLGLVGLGRRRRKR